MCHRIACSRRRRGAAAVEAALTIGACLIFMFAIFEYGRFVMMRHLLDNAAREGARVAVISPGWVPPETATAGVESTIATYLAGQPFEALAIQLYKCDDAGTNIGAWTDAPFGNNIAVDVSANYRPILPTFGFLPDPVTLRAKVVMRSEAN